MSDGGNPSAWAPDSFWTSDDTAPTAGAANAQSLYDLLQPQDSHGFGLLFGPECAMPAGDPAMAGKRPLDEPAEDSWDEQSRKQSCSGKGDAGAARTKADREKQRREKLNTRRAARRSPLPARPELR